jgi:hypothetical protein
MNRMNVLLCLNNRHQLRPEPFKYTRDNYVLDSLDNPARTIKLLETVHKLNKLWPIS